MAEPPSLGDPGMGEHSHDDHGHDHGHDHDHDHGHDHEHDHDHGSFSTGQEEQSDTPEKEHRGDFAEGQQAGHLSVHDARGDFAEGQEDAPHEHDAEPGAEPGGDFARGEDHHDPR